MTHLVEYVLCSNRSLMVRISECISGRTRALYSAFIKMDCKSCPLYLLLMGPLSMLCIVNSCNATGCIIKPWYLYLSLKHRISFCLLRTSLKSIYFSSIFNQHCCCQLLSRPMSFFFCYNSLQVICLLIVHY